MIAWNKKPYFRIVFLNIDMRLNVHRQMNG